jgi:hypothetical protein
MRQIFKIKPKNGYKLRFPNAIDRFLSDDGDTVEWNSYWQRRLNDGDVEIVSTMSEEKKFISESKKKDDEEKGLKYDDSI